MGKKFYQIQQKISTGVWKSLERKVAYSGKQAIKMVGIKGNPQLRAVRCKDPHNDND